MTNCEVRFDICQTVFRQSKTVRTMRNFLFVALLAVVTTASYSQRTWDTIPVLPDVYKQRTELFKKEPVVTGKIVFLGNSITQGGNWKKLLGDSTVINRGVGGDITYSMLLRLDDVIQRGPSKVFLLIGINDISKGIPEEVIMENIFMIVSKLRSAKAEVVVQSVLPVNPSVKDFPEKYAKQEQIIVLNTQLKKYADRLKYTFVDLYTEFLDKENRLDVKYTHDGLHLNAAGYSKWVAILKAHKYL